MKVERLSEDAVLDATRTKVCLPLAASEVYGESYVEIPCISLPRVQSEPMTYQQATSSKDMRVNAVKGEVEHLQLSAELTDAAKPDERYLLAGYTGGRVIKQVT